MGSGGILQAYETGRGRVVMRGESEIEELGGGKSRILVSSIPYQVNKSRLIEKIAELVNQRRIEGISDIRDESDRTGMRIVIELKRDVNSKRYIKPAVQTYSAAGYIRHKHASAC